MSNPTRSGIWLFDDVSAVIATDSEDGNCPGRETALVKEFVSPFEATVVMSSTFVSFAIGILIVPFWGVNLTDLPFVVMTTDAKFGASKLMTDSSAAIFTDGILVFFGLQIL